MKMLVFLSLICFGLSSCGNAQSGDSKDTGAGSYEAWKKEAVMEIRLKPKYGHAVKSAAQKEADARLISTTLEKTGTARKGSDALVSSGFKYLNEGNLRTAMYRFNQAWLLDSTNSDVFWGYAAVYYAFKDYDMALKQLDEGVRLNPRNAKIITDQGTIHFTRYHLTNDKKDLARGVALLNQSYAIDPLDQNTLYKLSVCYFMQDNCALAKRYFVECKKLGGRPITAAYTDELLKKCRQ